MIRTIRVRTEKAADVAFELTSRDASTVAAALVVAADQYAADAETCELVPRAAQQFRDQERVARELARAFDVDGGVGA